jgi:hypothetical protein
MATHVVKRADTPIDAAGNENRSPRGSEVLREVRAIPRQLFDPTDVEPSAFEDGVAFQVVELG